MTSRRDVDLSLDFRQIEEDLLSREEETAPQDESETVVMSEEERKTMELRRREEAKARFAKLLQSITSFQAICRRNVARGRYERLRIQCIYGAQVIQNCVRRFLATRRVKDIRRKKFIGENVRQMRENDDMREAELESAFYEFIIHSIIDIQRCFRGWKGRELAAFTAIQNARHKGKKFYDMNKASRRAYEHYLRLAAAREHKRNNAATNIQRIVRGFVDFVVFEDACDCS